MYIHIHMSTKTISITTKAYLLLKAKKRRKESFSDVIVRSFPKHSIFDLVGVFSEKEADEIETNIKDLRKRSRERADRIAKELE